MKVLGSLFYVKKNYNNAVNEKRNNVCQIKPMAFDSVSFGAGLTPAARNAVGLLLEGLKNIEHYFASVARPVQVDLKKNYNKLVARKGPGFTFKIPQYNEQLSVVRNTKDRKLLRITVKNDIKEDTLLLDEDRLVNHNRGLRDENIEEYVNLAKDEIEKFNAYLKVNVYGKPNNDTSAKKITKTASSQVGAYAKKVLKSGVADYTNAPLPVKKIMKIFESDGSGLSQNIQAVISPSSKQVVGLSTVADDGTRYSVSKGIKADYGDALTYLTFKKISPDNIRSYLTIDLKSYKFLMLNKDFKPLIKNNAVYEYSEQEVAKRGMDKRLEDFVDRFTKGIELPDKTVIQASEKVEPIKSAELVKHVEKLPEEQAKAVSEPKAELKISRGRQNKGAAVKEGKLFNKSAMIEKVKLQAQSDAKLAADEYFKAFAEEFQKNIDEKLAAFRSKLLNLFNNDLKS